MDEFRLSLQEVRRLCDHVLSAIGEDVGEDVSLHVDYYWSIPREELYDVYREPSELTVGQVQENLENVRKTLAQADGVVVPQALRWLGAVLTAIGDELTP